MSVLIVGGAGYIGSQTAKVVAAAGLQPVVFDNLVYGHEWAVKGTFWHPLTYMCAALLASLAIELTGRRTYAKEIAEIQARNEAR